MQDTIRVQGARVNNLKNISVSIPRDKLTVITGLSGSGKSSLAFDTIYAEGQRRYVESLSSYARMFLGQKELLAKYGFQIEDDFCNLETAYKAVYKGKKQN